MSIKNISFVGLGLIGGSLAKLIKKYTPNVNIYVRASKKTVEAAYSQGICVNKEPLEIKDLGLGDIIFLCAPVDVNVIYLKELKQHLTKEHILTDVGSVKKDIHIKAKEYEMEDIFVGGHPMAGSEKWGFEHSDASIVKGCLYCLTTPNGKSNEKSLILSEFLKNLNVRTRLLSYEQHDKSAAAISHVPHILSAALVNTVEQSDEGNAMRDMAASGFFDVTRIAKSNPDIWQQISNQNKDYIKEILTLFSAEISQLVEILDKNDMNALYNFFNNAKKYREKLDRDK